MKQFGVVARLLAIVAVLSLGAFVISGCGGDDNGGNASGGGDGKTFESDQALGDEGKVVVESEDSFDAQQQEVIDQITAFGDATANKDYKALCGELLSKEASNIGGDCEKTFSQTGEALKDFKLTIKDVKVGEDGKTATANVSVTSNVSPDPQTQQLSLVKEGNEWKIQILGQ
ncbi:MAG: hypothetical protein ACPGWS_02990 [Solirubrobacterales bacterium]